MPALDLPNMPRDYNYDYVTKAEQKVVQDPLMKSIAAQIDASSPQALAITKAPIPRRRTQRRDACPPEA